MFLIVLIFFAAALVSTLVVPPIRNLCERWNLTDHPDGHRKLHSVPVPWAGALRFSSRRRSSASRFCSSAVSIRCSRGPPMPTWSDWAWRRSSFSSWVLPMTPSGLRGRQKLLGQIIACSVPIFRGLLIERLQLFGQTIDLGPLSAPFTMLWLLAAVNAVNLLDGINGLATLVGLIDCLAIALLSQVVGHEAHAVLSAAFAGSLLGFLRYNFPQAKLFLGDAGAMLIGLVVGILSIESSLKAPGTVLLAVPLCLMTVPLFDSAAAMMRRKLTGRSIFSGDRVTSSTA